MKDYYNFTPEELMIKAKIPLKYFADGEETFAALAEKMIKVITRNNEVGESTVIICPVGPTGHYPFFIKRVNEEKISLANVWFINMDEFLDEQDQLISPDSVLSFIGFMEREVYAAIDETLVMPLEQRIYPDPQNIELIPNTINDLGKVDLCIGGVGINGHVAFNEPKPELSREEFLSIKTHIGDVAPETRTVTAIGTTKGAIEMIPLRCITIGMHEIYHAKEIVLGVFRDWHNGVLKRAVCGDMSTEFPVSLLQEHANATIYVSNKVFES